MYSASPSCGYYVFLYPGQAGASIALLVASYILQQRLCPFVATESIAESLRLTPSALQRRLQQRLGTSDGPTSITRTRGVSRAGRGPGEGQATPPAQLAKPTGPKVVKGVKGVARQPSRRRSMARAGVSALVSGVLRVITYKVGCACVCIYWCVLSMHMVHGCRDSLCCIVHRDPF